MPPLMEVISNSTPTPDMSELESLRKSRLQKNEKIYIFSEKMSKNRSLLIIYILAKRRRFKYKRILFKKLGQIRKSRKFYPCSDLWPNFFRIKKKLPKSDLPTAWSWLDQVGCWSDFGSSGFWSALKSGARKIHLIPTLSISHLSFFHNL